MRCLLCLIYHELILTRMSTGSRDQLEVWRTFTTAFYWDCPDRREDLALLARSQLSISGSPQCTTGLGPEQTRSASRCERASGSCCRLRSSQIQTGLQRTANPLKPSLVALLSGILNPLLISLSTGNSPFCYCFSFLQFDPRIRLRLSPDRRGLLVFRIFLLKTQFFGYLSCL